MLGWFSADADLQNPVVRDGFANHRRRCKSLKCPLGQINGGVRTPVVAAGLEPPKMLGGGHD
jgi:hypothetical protein